MSAPALNPVRFRTTLIAGLLAWSVLHTYALHQFGFGWSPALIDSSVTNSLLALSLLLVSTILRFYIPRSSRVGFVIALSIALTIVWLLISRAILMFLLKDTPGYDSFFSASALIRSGTAFLITSCGALVSLLWYTSRDQQLMEERKAEAERLSKEAELFKLRQQLQPHFLFNSLNSINALIGSQPQKARTMIQQLSDFLRGTLRRDDQQWVSLDEELQHLHLYLEIEKLRFGHRLTTEILDETPPGSVRLPGMLLQPVMENAIKFGLYDTTGIITIRLEARKEGADLLLEVTNPFDPETSTPRKGTGFGLNSVERRLYLLFARHDLLRTETRDHHFITRIKIPQPNDAHPHHR